MPDNESRTVVCHTTLLEMYYSLFRHEWLAQGVTQKIVKYMMRRLEDELYLIIHCASPMHKVPEFTKDGIIMPQCQQIGGRHYTKLNHNRNTRVALEYP